MNFITLSKDPQTLNNHDLLARARELAHEERRVGVALLHHLREIERRRLFALNHSSLHEYVVRELGYSDGAAHRRISAMRLMNTIPEVEDRLRSGALTLSTASQVQNFLRAEKKLTGNSASTTEVRQLVAQMEGKSTRDAEALLAARAPDVAQHLAARRLERPRTVGVEHAVQVTLTLNRELQLKLQRLRDRTAHRDPNPSLAQQIEWLADFALAKLSGASRKEKEISQSAREPSDPRVFSRALGEKGEMSNSGAEAPSQLDNSGAEAPSQLDNSCAEVPSRPGNSCAEVPSRPGNSGAEARKSPPGSPQRRFPSNPSSRTVHSIRNFRYIPAPLRRDVWRRANARCQMRLRSGLRCTRTHQLQIDHVMPVAWGGRTTADNLQLLCSVHNGMKSDRLPGE